MRFIAVVLLWAALIGMGLFAVVTSVLSHDAPSGWSYPQECCSDRDCRELSDNEIPKPLDGGNWLLATGEFVPVGKVKWSPDGKYHVCRSQTIPTAIYCLFVPPQGS